MTTQVETEVFGTVPAPKNIDETIAVITQSTYQERNPSYTNNIFYWRGQADISWKINSSLYRHIDTENKHPTERDITFEEQKILAQATEHGFQFHEGRRLCELELLAKLQHYGIPTRLIDFSFSFWFALWITSIPEEHLDKTGVVIGIDRSDVSHISHANENMTKINLNDFDLSDPNLKPIKDFKAQYKPDTPWDSIPVHELIRNRTFTRSEDGYSPFAWIPSPLVPRIAAQHSIFLFSETDKYEWGSLAHRERHSIALAITPELKQQLNKLWIPLFDFDYRKLFPDIEGFSKNFKK
ncbi:FRG domain-containing protein [Lujinxingia vulgaris]|uniref:FRG domain-containing protein n=1 Tax=Lujinxingia vulgaris TaxID=2600176 RepID=A0A5C6XLB0_9DELT|nr:FRG domain-containing protein [Lujinxingia vulgaris]TXD38387.1 FRG domain-containing protein [Lujinxingia vulgaris]